MEDRDRIVELVDGSDMIFITAGMGGGTGTGAAPSSRRSQELGILTVAVVTKPSRWKATSAGARGPGHRRTQQVCRFADHHPEPEAADRARGDTTLLDAFKSANQVLQGAVQGIAELITRPGLSTSTLRTSRPSWPETGMAMMGSGAATGENRARAAAEAAISSPLLEDVNLSGAHGC